MVEKILTDMEISSFCMEMSMLLKAGMPLEEGLHTMVEEENTVYGKAFLSSIYESVSSGSSFHDALKNSEAFPSYMINMVSIGEKTGNLENILHELNSYYESKAELTSNIKSAVIYPFIMAIMMTVVLLVLSLKVLPIFSQIYQELGSGIPASVIIITKVASFGSIVLAMILSLGIIGAVVFTIRSKNNPNKNNLFEKSKIIELIARSRFASVISLAFSSGLDVDYAMDLAEVLVEHPFMQKKIQECKQSIAKGESFSDALRGSGLFDGMNAGLISTGFRSGNIEEAMKMVSIRYKSEAERKLEETVAFIEPALVITMAVFVGIILLVVMMPMLGIMSTMG